MTEATRATTYRAARASTDRALHCARQWGRARARLHAGSAHDRTPPSGSRTSSSSCATARASTRARTHIHTRTRRHGSSVIVACAHARHCSQPPNRALRRIDSVCRGEAKVNGYGLAKQRARLATPCPHYFPFSLSLSGCMRFCVFAGWLPNARHQGGGTRTPVRAHTHTQARAPASCARPRLPAIIRTRLFATATRRRRTFTMRPPRVPHAPTTTENQVRIKESATNARHQQGGGGS